jgi:myo-inositol 2-dehydrogenase / D-chiro-inositol 1-dehydrogenase
MATAGDLRRTTMTFHGPDGVVADTWRRNLDLFHDAYTAELAAFAACVRTGATPGARRPGRPRRPGHRPGRHPLGRQWAPRAPR